MSYNITSWTTQALDNFCLHFEHLKLPQGFALIIGGSEVTIEFYGHRIISGKMADGDPHHIDVTRIDIYGEGSGHLFTSNEFQQILRDSTGGLVALLIWEGGDSISKLLVQDGHITDVDVDLSKL